MAGRAWADSAVKANAAVWLASPPEGSSVLKPAGCQALAALSILVRGDASPRPVALIAQLMAPSSFIQTAEFVFARQHRGLPVCTGSRMKAMTVAVPLSQRAMTSSSRASFVARWQVRCGLQSGRTVSKDRRTPH